QTTRSPDRGGASPRTGETLGVYPPPRKANLPRTGFQKRARSPPGLQLPPQRGWICTTPDPPRPQRGGKHPEKVRHPIFLCQNVTIESQSSYDKKVCFKEEKGDGEAASFRCEEAAVIGEEIKGYVDQSARTAVPRLWPKLARTAIYCQNSRASVAISTGACS